MTQPKGLDFLAGTVAPEVLLDAIRTSQRLAELGVDHALIGGLAVGLYGHARATKDVDILVGDSAFSSTSPFVVYREELHDLVKMGVIDLLSVPPQRPVLARMLQNPTDGSLPVIELPGLILMKLDASRPQDTADIHRLLDLGADESEIGAFLAEHAPDLVDRFAALLDSRI